MPKIVLILTFVLLTPALCFAQGILDSVLGPGGLGVWGGGGSNQFNYQQFQGQPAGPESQQGYQQGASPYAQPAPGYGAPQGYGAPGNAAPPPAYPNYSQQGVYSDWQNYQQPQSAPQGPPPVSYSAPPTQQAPQPTQAPLAQTGQGQLRPGQYSQSQQPPQFDDNLPAGAVRITTQTPDGTTVQYYPPQGEDLDEQAVSGRQTRVRRGQSQPKQAGAKKQIHAPQSAATQGSGTSIAMPRPVEIPQGQDPRSGWNSFNSGAPMAPPVQ